MSTGSLGKSSGPLIDSEEFLHPSSQWVTEGWLAISEPVVVATLVPGGVLDVFHLLNPSVLPLLGQPGTLHCQVEASVA